MKMWIQVAVFAAEAFALRPALRRVRRGSRVCSSLVEDDGSTRPWGTYSVVHEDDDLIVVDKSSGLLTVPGRGAHKADCLVSRLRATIGEDVGVPHRLDRDTSGLMVFSKTKAALRGLSMAFQAREVKKLYVGAVLGRPEHTFGTVDAPIGKVPTPAGYRRVALLDEGAGGRASRTNWALLEDRGSTSILSLEPVTGRAQQLRVHLASLGLPLLGDALHGTDEAEAAAPRLCLHASRLEFAHPATLETAIFESEPDFVLTSDYASLAGGGARGAQSDVTRRAVAP